VELDAIGYARQMRVELYKQALLDDAKGRVANGLPIGPNADYRFKKEILMRLAQLKEGYVDEPTAEMFNRSAKASGDDGAKKPVVILRKKGGVGSGSGSAGGNGGVKEIVTKEAQSLSDANAPVAHASEETAAFGDTIIADLKGNVNDFVASLSPDQKVAVDYFKGSSAFLWQDIVDAQRVDLVIRAMNAASSNLGGAPSPVVFGAALTRLAEHAGMMDMYGAYMLDGAGKKELPDRGIQQQPQQFLYTPGVTSKVGR
ncbi:MAG TPA: hypothetical protein PLY45_04960, partial [bacterium]|nr:hypothetical protein [bacterium]